MVTPRLRPRLEMEVEIEPPALAGSLERALAHPDAPCRGLATERQIDLGIRGPARHFWSPQLVVLVRPRDEGGSSLTGHFGPNANVWTMFMACYGFVVFGTITAVFYGLSQLVLGKSAWALWSIPAAAVAIVLIYFAAGIGQRLGRDQVDVLLRFLESAVEQGEENAS